MDEDVKRSVFVRSYLIQNPTSDVEQLVKAWAAFSGGKSGELSPKTIYSQRNLLKQKYKFASLTDVPRRSNGEINISALIRHIVKLHPKITESKCSKMLRQDGIILSGGLFRHAQNVSEENLDASNDLQETGHRARVVKKLGRPVGSSKKKTGESSHKKSGDSLDMRKRLESLEDRLDEIIHLAKKSAESDIVQELKDARRAVSSMVIEL